jgi:hypothetical protein
MLAKLAQTAGEQITRIKEDLPLGNIDDDDDDDDSLVVPPRTDNDKDDVATDSPKTAVTTKSVFPTHSLTPSKHLKKLRSPSILSNKEISSSLKSYESVDSEHTEYSNSDSIRCNNANMSNKITGEMGVQIFPSPTEDGVLVLKYEHDRHFQYVHPNVFAPACLTDVERMGGGGSGVSVFSGTHPELGKIVMKHGGFSDMKELFALATISAELTKRGSSAQTNTTLDASEVAARSMKSCLPEFKMVYISPQHVLYKPKAVWGKLKKLVRIGSDRQNRDTFASLAMKIELSERHLNAKKSILSSQSSLSSSASSSSSRRSWPPPLITLNDSKFLGPGAQIRIYECDTGKAMAYLEDIGTNVLNKKPGLAFVVPKDHTRSIDDSTLALDCSEDFNSLEHLYESLSPLMQKHLFKFTLAQKRIGGTHAKTGSQWMYDGKLDGLLLDNLIAKFIETVRNLQKLTLPEEVDVVDQIRDEVSKLKGCDVKSDGLSAMADQFMGNAIKKNFHPTKGRIRFLRKTCREFRESKLYLLPEEELPSRHLATLGEPDAFMSDVFVGASSEPPLFHPDKDFWINLMMQATSDRPSMSPNATKQIWTSGLADAGIHNLFVSKDDLYFFDLGVPQLQSLPGFMTKFLFSFFHIIGMEEDENSPDNEWVRRFVPVGDKLALTKETSELLPKAYDAFSISMSKIIDEVFDGDQSLRWLLLQYVTLQLLSDASFCLQRWNMKGGGRPREDNHNHGLERWLWRALWDTYVAFDINTAASWKRLHVEHPTCNESNKTIGEEIKGSIWGNMSMQIDVGNDNLHELLKLDETLELQIEEDEETEKGKHQYSEKEGEFEFKALATPPRQRRSSAMNRRASSLMRWSTEKLNQASLRELSVAHFEYNHDSDDDDQALDDDDTESDDDSAIHPMEPALYSLVSLKEGMDE